jgi:hypothetical protein
MVRPLELSQNELSRVQELQQGYFIYYMVVLLFLHYKNTLSFYSALLAKTRRKEPLTSFLVSSSTLPWEQ